MGSNTTNSYFYKPAYGEYGQSNMALFDTALNATDAVIKDLVDVHHTHYYEKQTITATHVANGYIDLTGSYTIANNSLQVWVRTSGGIFIPVCITDDYTETSATRVTFGANILEAGGAVIFRWWK